MPVPLGQKFVPLEGKKKVIIGPNKIELGGKVKKRERSPFGDLRANIDRNQ